MLRTRNKYCSNCLATQRFLDLGTCLVCERCTKRLEIEGAPGAEDSPTVAHSGRILVLPAVAASQREAG